MKSRRIGFVEFIIKIVFWPLSKNNTVHINDLVLSLISPSSLRGRDHHIVLGDGYGATTGSLVIVVSIQVPTATASTVVLQVINSGSSRLTASYLYYYWYCTWGYSGYQY